MRWTETTLFLKEALFSPRQIGALFPSSNNLAAAMAQWLPEDPQSYVMELGPGTGTVTRALLNKGLSPDRLVTIEKSEKLSDHLRSRFPDVHVLTGDAFALDQLVQEKLPCACPVGAVISSLPLRNFTPKTVRRFSRAISSVLRPGGLMVQFSYHIHNRRIHALDQLRQRGSQIIWKNFPPARLYIYQKPHTKPARQLAPAL